MSFSVSAEGSSQLESIRRRFDINDSVIVVEKGTQITLFGRITPATALAFKKGMDQEKNIKIVFVDSIGGDVDSAIDIGRIIKNRKLNLVVDGRCFSACASYIFPAAEHKTVLPGSFVGIHEESTFYIEEGVLKFIQDKDAENVAKSTSERLALENLQQLKIKEKIFVKQLAINDKLHSSYAAYLSNRKTSFGDEKKGFESSYPNCPPIHMWVLNKQQLISMGIKGIGEFWYPSNNEEKKMLSTYFKFSQDSAFYGEARDLEQVCKNVSNNWFFRRFHDLKSSILSKLNSQL